MFLCGLEVFMILTVGVLYLCCDNIQDNKEGEKDGAEFEALKCTWFHKITQYIAKIKGGLFKRIHSDTCCICYEDIKTEVQSSCGHIFCGSCILEFWFSKNKERIDCPLCRREINMLMINSSKVEALQDEKSTIAKNVKDFNKLFSHQPQNFEEVLSSVQSLAESYLTKFITKEKFFSLVKKFLPIFLGITLLIYIICPTVLMPQSTSMAFLLENVLLIGLCFLCATLKYSNSSKIEVEEDDE